MLGTQFSYVKNDNRSVAGTHWNVLTTAPEEAEFDLGGDVDSEYLR